MRFVVTAPLIAVAVLAAACGASKSAAPEPLTIRFPQAVNEAHPRMVMTRKFAARVEAGSQGRIRVQSFPGGELYGARQAVQAAAVGDVEMALEPETHFITFDDAYRALDVPFLFETPDEFQRFIREDFSPRVAPAFERAGLRLLASWDEGPMILASRERLVRSPADFSGLKIRSSGHELLARSWNDMGAATLNIPIQEVYSALQQGVAHAIYTTFNTFVAGKTYEVAPKVVRWPARSVYVWVVNKAFWDALPDADRALLTQAAAETTTEYDALIWSNYDELVKTVRAAPGGEFYELTAADLAALQTRLRPLLDGWTREFATVLARGPVPR